ncbi:MAG: hypothetical protein ACYCW6_16825 [Candidatus Xenobia bacterium]
MLEDLCVLVDRFIEASRLSPSLNRLDPLAGPLADQLQVQQFDFWHASLGNPEMHPEAAQVVLESLERMRKALAEMGAAVTRGERGVALRRLLELEGSVARIREAEMVWHEAMVGRGPTRWAEVNACLLQLERLAAGEGEVRFATRALRRLDAMATRLGTAEAAPLAAIGRHGATVLDASWESMSVPQRNAIVGPMQSQLLALVDKLSGAVPPPAPPPPAPTTRVSTPIPAVTRALRAAWHLLEGTVSDAAMQAQVEEAAAFAQHMVEGAEAAPRGTAERVAQELLRLRDASLAGDRGALTTLTRDLTELAAELAAVCPVSEDEEPLDVVSFEGIGDAGVPPAPLPPVLQTALDAATAYLTDNDAGPLQKAIADMRTSVRTTRGAVASMPPNEELDAALSLIEEAAASLEGVLEQRTRLALDAAHSLMNQAAERLAAATAC